MRVSLCLEGRSGGKRTWSSPGPDDFQHQVGGVFVSTTAAAAWRRWIRDTATLAPGSGLIYPPGFSLTDLSDKENGLENLRNVLLSLSLMTPGCQGSVRTTSDQSVSPGNNHWYPVLTGEKVSLLL